MNHPFDNDMTPNALRELASRMPKIAEMLDERQENLAVLDAEYWPNKYMKTDMRDRVVATAGSFDTLPFVRKDRNQLATVMSIGYGIVIYENHLDPSLRYGTFATKDDYGDTIFLIIAKNKLFKLKRNIARAEKELSKNAKPPVLEEGMLEEILKNTIGFLLKGKQIEKFGVRIKRGIILDGPPGNGKTSVCRYIQKLCSQNDIDWGVVTSSEIDDAYSNKSLDSLMQMNAVTFFDDIDIAYMDRSKGKSAMACSLLTAMDGMSEKGHLIRIFTTNESVQEMDPAFIRPGRIDKCITIKKPNEALRMKLVTDYWPKELTENINVDELMRRSDGYSFAELEAIRTFLVTNKIVADAGWDLDRAFDEFSEFRAEKKKGKHVGF